MVDGRVERVTPTLRIQPARCAAISRREMTQPEHGRPVTFVVTSRQVNVARAAWGKRYETRYVVGLKGSGGNGFSHHTSFEVAVRHALARARRYELAYSRPRGLAATS